MPKYDGQIVLGFQSATTQTEVEYWVRGLGAKNSAATQGALEFYDVLRCDDFQGLKGVMGRISSAFSKLGSIRIYLVGHGGWQFKTLATQKANYFIKWIFTDSFLKNSTSVKVVNLMACELGVGPTSSGTKSALGEHSTNCFASDFHRQLKEKAGIVTKVHAYPTEVKVGADGKKYQHDPDTNANRRTYKKHIYYWENGIQMFRADDYTSIQRPE